ncbi:hypothetical protein PAMP_024022 [Pampus punctatissimus]
MGISASSLLDDATSNYIKGQAEAELKGFSPYYRKQFSVSRFSEVEDDLEQHKEKITQLLKQREAPEGGEVLYEEAVLYFDDTRKWRERYVVVRANYCLECHDGLETFVKGVPPRHKLLPTGGTVLTTEEKYMAMVDKCFPDDTNVKEDFAPPLSGMPGQFPVYLRLPYRRDSYFCFKQQVKQAAFLSILSDCIRHQNQDFLKKTTCEVQAFLKAIQLYRQDKGRYEAWDMLIGSDVRVMANLVMEQLLPSLEKDMLPRLKAKKTEKKRVWFATVEAAYILVQEHLLEGLSALKEDCRVSVRQQEVLIHSDMDQILNSRKQLEDKVRAKVSEPAEKLCCESVQPYLGSVLEELMEPISSGFQEGRQLSESMMDQVCQDVLQGGQNEQLKKLMENAASTFEQLLRKAVQDNPDNAGTAIEKAKHRVLKGLEQSVDTDHSNFIHVENVYERILLQILDKEVTKVVKEAASLKKYNLFTDSRDMVSRSSRSSLSSPSVSTPGTPALALASPTKTSSEPTALSPLVVNGLSSSPKKKEKEDITLQSKSPAEVTVMETPLGDVEQKDAAACAELPAPKAEEVIQTAETTTPSETQDVNEEAAAHIVIEEEKVISSETSCPEPKMQNTDAAKEAEITLSETPTVVESIKTDAEEPEPASEPVTTAAGCTGSQTATSSEETQCESSEVKLVAPPSGEEPVLTPGLELKVEEVEEIEDVEIVEVVEEVEEVEEVELAAASDPNSLDVSVGSESPPSDVESVEEVEALQSSEGDVTTTADVSEQEVDLRKSPVSSDEPPEEKTTNEEPQTEAASGDAEAGVSVEPSVETADAHPEPAKEDAASSPEAQPLDCIKEIRDLVVEVIEVEELLQRYPSGVPKEE